MVTFTPTDPQEPNKGTLTVTVSIYLDKLVTSFVSKELEQAIAKQAAKDIKGNPKVRSAIAEAATKKLLDLLEHPAPPQVIVKEVIREVPKEIVKEVPVPDAPSKVVMPKVELKQVSEFSNLQEVTEEDKKILEQERAASTMEPKYASRPLPMEMSYPGIVT